MAGVTCLRQNSRQAKNRELWAVEKWKSKTGIPTFPPPRPPAAARKKPILWMYTRGRIDGARGEISKEVWQRRFAPPAGQGVIVVDRENSCRQCEEIVDAGHGRPPLPLPTQQGGPRRRKATRDRKSTRLNSSHAN